MAFKLVSFPDGDIEIPANTLPEDSTNWRQKYCSAISRNSQGKKILKNGSFFKAIAMQLDRSEFSYDNRFANIPKGCIPFRLWEISDISDFTGITVHHLKGMTKLAEDLRINIQVWRGDVGLQEQLINVGIGTEILLHMNSSGTYSAVLIDESGLDSDSEPQQPSPQQTKQELPPQQTRQPPPQQTRQPGPQQTKQPPPPPPRQDPPNTGGGGLTRTGSNSQFRFNPSDGQRGPGLYPVARTNSQAARWANPETEPVSTRKQPTPAQQKAFKNILDLLANIQKDVDNHGQHLLEVSLQLANPTWDQHTDGIYLESAN